MFESLLSTVPGTIGLGLWECLAGLGRRRHQAPSRAGAWAAWSISLVCKLGGGLPGTFRRWRALCSDISLEEYPLVQFPRDHTLVTPPPLGIRHREPCPFTFTTTPLPPTKTTSLDAGALNGARNPSSFWKTLSLPAGERTALWWWTEPKESGPEEHEGVTARPPSFGCFYLDKHTPLHSHPSSSMSVCLSVSFISGPPGFFCVFPHLTVTGFYLLLALLVRFCRL